MYMYITDCSCTKPCPDESYDRDPNSDFECKRKSSSVQTSSRDSDLVKVRAQIRPYSTGLWLSYSFSSDSNISATVLRV